MDRIAGCQLAFTKYVQLPENKTLKISMLLSYMVAQKLYGPLIQKQEECIKINAT